MIWKGSLTWKGKKVIKGKWHKWFAWYPIIIGETKDNHNIVVWLQYIERKGEFHSSWGDGGWIYQYRKVR